MDVEPKELDLRERLLLHGVIGNPAGCQSNEALSPDNINLHEGEQLVKHAGLVDILRATNLTAHVMGTTDDAFECLPANSIKDVLSSRYLWIPINNLLHAAGRQAASRTPLRCAVQRSSGGRRPAPILSCRPQEPVLDGLPVD